MGGWILESDATPPRLLRLEPGAVRTIGRTAAADFILDAPLVSRVHCRLTATPGELVVEDLGSTNGTFVNGSRVERASLGAGDRLAVGRVTFSVLRAAAADDPAGG